MSSSTSESYATQSSAVTPLDGGHDYVTKHDELGAFESCPSQTTWLYSSMLLGHEAASANNHKDAVKIYERCLEPAETFWGPSHLSALEIRRAYANELTHLSKVTKAWKLLESVQAALEPQLTSAEGTKLEELRQIFAEIGNARLRLIKCLYLKGDFGEAARLSSINANTCSRVLGDEYELTIRSKADDARCRKKHERVQRNTQKPVLDGVAIEPSVPEPVVGATGDAKPEAQYSDDTQTATASDAAVTTETSANITQNHSTPKTGQLTKPRVSIRSKSSISAPSQNRQKIPDSTTTPTSAAPYKPELLQKSLSAASTNGAFELRSQVEENLDLNSQRRYRQDDHLTIVENKHRSKSQSELRRRQHSEKVPDDKSRRHSASIGESVRRDGSKFSDSNRQRDSGSRLGSEMVKSPKLHGEQIYPFEENAQHGLRPLEKTDESSQVNEIRSNRRETKSKNTSTMKTDAEHATEGRRQESQEIHPQAMSKNDNEQQHEGSNTKPANEGTQEMMRHPEEGSSPDASRLGTSPSTTSNEQRTGTISRQMSSGLRTEATLEDDRSMSADEDCVCKQKFENRANLTPRQKAPFRKPGHEVKDDDRKLRRSVDATTRNTQTSHSRGTHDLARTTLESTKPKSSPLPGSWPFQESRLETDTDQTLEKQVVPQGLFGWLGASVAGTINPWIRKQSGETTATSTAADSSSSETANYVSGMYLPAILPESSKTSKSRDNEIGDKRMIVDQKNDKIPVVENISDKIVVSEGPIDKMLTDDAFSDKIFVDNGASDKIVVLTELSDMNTLHQRYQNFSSFHHQEAPQYIQPQNQPENQTIPALNLEGTTQSLADPHRSLRHSRSGHIQPLSQQPHSQQPLLSEEENVMMQQFFDECDLRYQSFQNPPPQPNFFPSSALLPLPTSHWGLIPDFTFGLTPSAVSPPPPQQQQHFSAPSSQLNHPTPYLNSNPNHLNLNPNFLVPIFSNEQSGSGRTYGPTTISGSGLTVQGDFLNSKIELHYHFDSETKRLLSVQMRKAPVGD